MLRQILYFSTAADLQPKQTISAILDISRKRNALGSVSGVLIVGGLRYLQIIEGPDCAVSTTMERILSDRRHHDVNVMIDRDIAASSFSNWSMAFLKAPALNKYATFEDLVSALHHTVEPSLRDTIQMLSRSFAKTPIRLTESDTKKFRPN